MEESKTMPELGQTIPKEPISDGSVKTGKVIINVVVAVVVSFIVYFIVAILLGILVQFKLLRAIMSFFAWSAGLEWVMATISAVAGSFAALELLSVINKKTELERILSQKIAGWIYTVLGALGTVVYFIKTGSLRPGDSAILVMGVFFIIQNNLGMYKKN